FVGEPLTVSKFGSEYVSQFWMVRIVTCIFQQAVP
ncbi:hypothetical protein AAULR_25241, partial [Lacticaseibacillus rhamnosus MTCC 5462]